MLTWLSLMLSCTPKSGPASGGDAGAFEVPQSDPGSLGVYSPVLRSLVADHWNATMARYPTWASNLGDRRFEDRIFDPSAAAHEAWVRRKQGWALQASAVPDGALSPSDQLTRDLLVEELRGDLATERCRMHLWSLSARDNALVDANGLTEAPRLDTPEDAASLLARFRAVPAAVAASADNLRTGVAEGRVGNARSIEKVIAMVGDQLALPVEDSPLWRPAAHAPEGWDGADAWRADLREVIESSIRPAFAAYVAVVRDEVLPSARSGAEVGLHALPGGKECYAALIRAHTTLDRSADELHQLGLAELVSIHGEFRQIGARALGTSDLAEIFERLRTDRALRFDTAEQVEATAEDALARARAAIPQWFGRLPEAECVVEPIPDYLAPYTTIAYYQPARPDGSRPGIYYVNTLDPTSRPRFEAEVLAFHESIPGHHLQIVIAQELGDLPAFRRYGHVTAFVEGWALYTERLADEMGLYTGDLDRLGMLSFDAWRASRLVVDTGIHHLGWTREQAEAFMQQNTPLAVNNIANEVDRYVTTPGQALAYKVGQLEVAGLRRQAEAELGDAFDVGSFHDEVLGAGPLPLRVLASRIHAWMQRSSPPPEGDTSHQGSDGTPEAIE